MRTGVFNRRKTVLSATASISGSGESLEFVEKRFLLSLLRIGDRNGQVSSQMVVSNGRPIGVTVAPETMRVSALAATPLSRACEAADAPPARHRGRPCLRGTSRVASER